MHKESNGLGALANQEVTDEEAHIPKQQLPEYWLKQLELRLDDRDELLKKKWLTDKHISAVNKLLRHQYPKQNGLQDTILLAERSLWDSEPNRFIQIINISRQHWVCASTYVGCPEDVVDIYDSIPAYSTGSSTLRKQVAAIIHTTNPTFELRFIDIQRQSDCALFAIANEVALCLGKDPHSIRFEQTTMGQHLHDCFENGRMAAFPEKKVPRRLRQRVMRVKSVAVYCTCRQTDNGLMIKCHTCKD